MAAFHRAVAAMAEESGGLRSRAPRVAKLFDEMRENVIRVIGDSKKLRLNWSWLKTLLLPPSQIISIS